VAEVCIKSTTLYETFLLKNRFLEKLPCDRSKKYTPLHREWLKSYYWDAEFTAKKIASMLGVSEGWVTSEVVRLGLEKSKNGVKFRGKRGYEMPWLEKIKHHKQPHQRRVARVCPHTLHRVEIYDSLKAAARDGFRGERIRNAIKTNGTHRNYRWERVNHV